MLSACANRTPKIGQKYLRQTKIVGKTAERHRKIVHARRASAKTTTHILNIPAVYRHTSRHRCRATTCCASRAHAAGQRPLAALHCLSRAKFRVFFLRGARRQSPRRPVAAPASKRPVPVPYSALNRTVFCTVLDPYSYSTVQNIFPTLGATDKACRTSHARRERPVAALSAAGCYTSRSPGT